MQTICVAVAALGTQTTDSVMRTAQDLVVQIDTIVKFHDTCLTPIHAVFAAAGRTTKPLSAMQHVSSTGMSYMSASESQMKNQLTRTAESTASHSTDQGLAINSNAPTEFMHAHFAAANTAHNLVLHAREYSLGDIYSNDIRKIVTPLQPDIWRDALLRADLLSQYHIIPYKLEGKGVKSCNTIRIGFTLYDMV